MHTTSNLRLFEQQKVSRVRAFGNPAKCQNCDCARTNWNVGSKTPTVSTSFEVEGKVTPAKDEFEAKVVAKVGELLLPQLAQLAGATTDTSTMRHILHNIIQHELKFSAATF